MLSVRQLKKEIKNNAYERLDDSVKEKITLNNEEKISVTELIKNPLLINIEESNKYIKNASVLELADRHV